MNPFKLKDFISQTINRIEASLPENYSVSESINFGVFVITTQNPTYGFDVT